MQFCEAHFFFCSLPLLIFGA
ncbi:hypothetical protein CP8484711_1966A, partial [Chlamydia psittaci 84-8471/1]